MRWNANRRSGRPADPSAYWRRRFFILGGGLAVLAVLAWQFTGKGPSAGTPAADGSSMAALQAGETLPSAAYGSPAAEPSLTTPAEIPPTTAPPVTPSAKQSSAKPKPSASASAGTAGPSCAPGDIVLSLFPSQASYGQTAQPQFHVYAVSTASSPCQLPYGAGSVRVVVTRLGQVVWDSSTCKPAAAKPVQFQLGVPQLLTVSWNRQATGPSGCAGSLPAGATGTFDAVAQTAGQSSHVSTFTLDR
ncbi:MAG: hypothetical protein ACRDNO_05245 [Trebonia sp.]